MKILNAVDPQHYHFLKHHEDCLCPICVVPRERIWDWCGEKAPPGISHMPEAFCTIRARHDGAHQSAGCVEWEDES